MEKSKAIIELNTQNKLVWTNPNTLINEINVSSCLLKYSGSQIRNKKISGYLLWKKDINL